MNPNGKDSQVVATVPLKRRPSNVWLIIVAALFIIVPFLTWYGTWFGRDISDEEITSEDSRLGNGPGQQVGGVSSGPADPIE